MAHMDTMLGQLTGASLNSTADQAIPIGAAKYIVRRIVATNPSGTPTLAAGGIYTGAAKTGTVVVGAAQAYSALSAALAALDLTLAAGALGAALTAAQLFFALTTAQGSAITVDLYVFGDALA